MLQLDKPTRAVDPFSILEQAYKSDRRQTIFSDISDLLSYFRHHVIASGIQRVQLAWIQSEIENDDSTVVFTYSEPKNQICYAIDVDSLRALIAVCLSRNADMNTLGFCLDKIAEGLRRIEFSSNDIFFISGAFWNFPDSYAHFADLKSRGVTLGVLVYDIIPITNPEFCEVNLVRMFNRSFAECATLFDFIVSISESTALQLRKLFDLHGIKRLPIAVVPLGHAMIRRPQLEKATANFKSKLIGIAKNYALCVGTIESRKNHNYLFQVWRALIENPRLPQLVIVGRVGWRVKDFIEQVELTNGLQGRIKILENVSDSELATLYEGARFTLFPSFVEGWGLPVGESLHYGKLCVASSTSSIPEVGGDLVDYIDPLDATSCIKAVRKIIDDEAYLARRETDIREKFKVRPWEQTIFDLRQQITALASLCVENAKSPFVPEIPLRCILGAGEQARPDAPISIFASALQNVIFQSGWYWPEAWGRWISGSRAVIQFKVTEAEPLRIYLETHCVAHAEENQIVLTTGGNSSSHPGRGRFQRWIAVDTTPSPDGLVEIEVNVNGEIKSPDGIDPRSLSVGVRSMFVVPLSDVASRTEFMERVIFFR